MQRQHSRRPAVSLFLIMVAGIGISVFAQQANTGTAVPAMVSFSSVLVEANGKPITSITGVTFSLYAEQEGGAPLWTETQNVVPDKAGHYSVMLGSTTSQGLPSSVFVSGQARWLGIRPQDQEEQPRTLLLSVPYALKALDAETIGGKPASAFMLAPSNQSGPAGTNPTSNITGSGTADYVPIFTGTTTIGNSKIYQNASGDVGIGTTSPAATLDVKGKGDVRDTLTLFPKSTHPALTLSGTALSVSNTGVITFVSGQTFPGTGTVTSVGSGAGLTGGPITNSGTLSIANNGVTNSMLQNSSLTVTANSPLSGGGSVALGGSTSLGLANCSANQILQFVSGAWTCENAPTGTITGVTAGTDLTGGGSSGNVTVNLDTTKVPQLASANTFTQPLAVNATANTGSTITGTNASQYYGTAAVEGNATFTGTGSTIGVSGYSQSSAGWGVYGIGGAAGVYGGSPNGTGVSGNSGSGNGVDGATDDTTGGYAGVEGWATSSGIGVLGYSSSGIGVQGQGAVTGVVAGGGVNGVIGVGSAAGVAGYGSSGAAGNAGVFGAQIYEPTSNQIYGVSGFNGASNYGAGVFGVDALIGESGTGSNWPYGGAGVWGDGGADWETGQANIGVLGTADDYIGVWAENNTTHWFTLYAYNENSSGGPFYAGNPNGYCYIDASGNFHCNGANHAVVPIDGGQRKVALSAIESPKNWFEDFGSAQLTNGSAIVTIDPEYAQTVNTEMDYKVFPVPNGECNGLYVTHKTATSFEVRELHSGASSVSFDYRIVALRKNYENIRLADHTNDPDPRKMMAKRGTGIPFRFDASKIKPPEIHAPSALHQPPQVRRPVEMPKPAQVGK